MKTTKIFVEDEYRYDVVHYRAEMGVGVHDLDVYELRYSSDPMWSHPNQLIFKLEDDGNFDIKLTSWDSLNTTLNTLVLDINQISELKILFDEYERINGYAPHKRFQEIID